MAANLRGRIDNTDRLARTLANVARRASDDPFKRTRRVISSGLPNVSPNDIANRQIIAKDFRTALNVGTDAAGVVFDSDGIRGYNSSVTKTFDIGTDGSGTLGTGSTKITWGTTGTVDVPGGALTAGSVTGSKIANDTITNALLKSGAQPYTSTVAFSGTAYNAISWTSGTITFGDGSTQSISSGSSTGLTGSTTHYVYATIGSTTLTVTTDGSAVYGDAKVLLATVVVGASTDGDAPTILPFNSKSPTLSAVAIAANAIIADHIQANTITADKLDITELSAITADLGTVTAGTLTGATIRSAASGDRVEIDSTGLTLHGPTSSLFQFRATADGSIVGKMWSHELGIGIEASRVIMDVTDVVPSASDGGSLGTSSAKWGTAYISDVHADTVNPITNGSGSVGASGHEWGSGVIQSIVTNQILAISGDLQFHLSAGSNTIGFFGATPVVKQSISGSRSDGTALADLLTSLEALGLIVDGSSA